MNNRERDEPVESFHILVALRRKKENRGCKERCFRQIIKDEELDMRILKEKMKMIPGTWRIYKTITKRNVVPAMKIMMKRLIDEPERFQYRISSLWKNCLLQKECKVSRDFLIDIDTETIPEALHDLIKTGEIIVDEVIRTPNGWHMVCSELDTRKLQGLDVEFKRDALKFVELIKND